MAELLQARPASDGLARLGVALADPMRQAILMILREGSACPGDLAERCGTSRSNLSNHLACLRGCGLVTARRDGRHLHYRLASPALARVLGELDDVVRATDCPGHLP